MRFSPNIGSKMNLKKTDFSKIGRLRNFSNSCFIDSVLYPLLVYDNPSTEYLLQKENDISTELIKIRNTLRKGVSMHCINLRKKLKKYQINGFENFSDGLPRDADEFLKFLFLLLGAQDGENVQITYGVRGNKKIRTSKSVIKASPIFDVHYSESKSPTTLLTLVNFPDVALLNDPLKTNFGTFYERVQYVLPYKHSFMIFHVNRSKKGLIVPEQSIKLSCGRVLTLHAIILWNYFHYTTVMKHTEESFFYEYDDIKSGLTPIGSYKDILKWKNGNVLTNGVLYFYF